MFLYTIKVTFCKPSHKGAELCDYHVFYFLPFKGHSYEGDHWTYTERGGLYYVYEIAHKEHAMLTHETVTRQLSLWPKRLDILHLGTLIFYFLVY